MRARVDARQQTAGAVNPLLPFLAALTAGTALGVQAALNSELARHVGKVHAVAVSLAVSVVTVLVVLMLSPGDGSFARLGEVPRWALLGGICGVLVLGGTVLAVPRIGAASTTGLIVAAQVIASTLIDRFGLLGVTARAISVPRAVGLVLLIAAVVLVVRS